MNRVQLNSKNTHINTKIQIKTPVLFKNIILLIYFCIKTATYNCLPIFYMLILTISMLIVYLFIIMVKIPIIIAHIIINQ